MSGFPDMEGVEVLLADDERAARLAIAGELEAAGCRVRTVSGGQDAVREFSRSRPDVVLLDVMMPGMDGLETCRRLRRADPSAPVLFLTALDSCEAEIAGLGAGADGYVPKTAPRDVMLARIAAAARRSRGPGVRFAFGPATVDSAALEISLPDGSRSGVTEREAAMLRLFASRPMEVFSPDFLVTRFWGADFNGGQAALTMAVSRLRSKLGAGAAVLETVFRSGYRYRPEAGA